MALTPRVAALAVATPLTTEAAALIRNIVLARILGPDDLGRLMILALALRLVEMVSDVSIERLMAQADDGGSLRLQRGLHGLAIVRGVILATLLVVLAPALSTMFGHGDVGAPAFAALAIAPLSRGFAHLDHCRFERAFEFRPTLAVEGGTALAMVIVTPFAAAWLGDHRAIVPILVVQAAAMAGLSHGLAVRRYRVVFDPALLRRVWAFGAPLILNAALLFIIVNGDRLIVAAFFDFETLGEFGVFAQLAMLPALILGRAAAAVLLPAFRRARPEGTLALTVRRANAVFLGVAAAFAFSFVAVAPSAIAFVYGAEFALSVPLAMALGGAAAVRIARTPLSQFAVAVGRTDLPARANVWRAAALAPAAAMAVCGAPLAVIAATGIVGECMAAARMLPLMDRARSTTNAPVLGFAEGAA